MTDTLKALPGFDRLIGTLGHHGISAEPRPASHHALKAGAPILGDSFDPFLAALYARCDGGLFGDLKITGFAPEAGSSLMEWNEDRRESAPLLYPRLIKCFEYGSELGQPHFFATVPSLANAEGVQPVVFVLHYMDPLVYPLASSVDKAFDLWARYAEARLRRFGRLDEFMITLDVPCIWDEAQLIAQDAELVRMLEAGRFDELMGDEPERLKWKQAILQAARSQS